MTRSPRTGLLRQAVRSLGKNRSRSLLTSLGVVIGVASVIVMVGLGEGSQRRIESELSSLGTNLLMVVPGDQSVGGRSMGQGTRSNLTFDDVDALREEATALAAVSAVVRTQGQVIAGNANWSTTVYGVDPTYLDIRDWTVSLGASFDDDDVAALRKVALVGSTVAEELFGSDDPVGERIRIGSVPFTVVGVLGSKGQSGFGQDQDDVIMAPSTTVLHRLRGSTYLDMINASATSADAVDLAEAEIQEILRRSQELRDDDADTFSIRNQLELLDTFSETSRTLTLLLASIAGVSLLVGGIGIMNIMLVSVTERTREIGIRMSLGARGRDVLAQFLAEATLLSVGGGAIGVALAFVVAKGLTLASLPTAIEPQVVLLAVAVAGGIGIFFGFTPARRAAGLDPIDALRRE